MDALNAPLLTPLRRIDHPLGDIQHGMKAGDAGYAGFGEAYFTRVLPGAVKGWKRHRQMVLNLLVPCGAVRFYLRHDDGRRQVYLLGDAPDSVAGSVYARLTVPAGWWVAFEGVGPQLNQVLNLASMAHDPAEADNLPLASFALEPAP